MLASFWTAAMMMEHLGETRTAGRLLNGIDRVCAVAIMTPDVGGTSSVREVTDAMVHQIQAANS